MVTDFDYLEKKLPCVDLSNLKVNAHSIHTLDIGNTVKSQYLKVDGTIFYKFKLPEVQIKLHFG